MIFSLPQMAAKFKRELLYLVGRKQQEVESLPGNTSYAASQAQTDFWIMTKTLCSRFGSILEALKSGLCGQGSTVTRDYFLPPKTSFKYHLKAHFFHKAFQYLINTYSK